GRRLQVGNSPTFLGGREDVGPDLSKEPTLLFLGDEPHEIDAVGEAKLCRKRAQRLQILAAAGHDQPRRNALVCQVGDGAKDQVDSLVALKPSEIEEGGLLQSAFRRVGGERSEEHTSELQSR